MNYDEKTFNHLMLRLEEIAYGPKPWFASSQLKELIQKVREAQKENIPSPNTSDTTMYGSQKAKN